MENPRSANDVSPKEWSNDKQWKEQLECQLRSYYLITERVEGDLDPCPGTLGFIYNPPIR